MATIKDVAKLAGVSLGTVSNVLNGKTHNFDLIQRVESAMAELEYYPDATARSLKNTKTDTIGLIVPDTLQQKYSKYTMLLEERLREKGYTLIVKFSRNNRLLERNAIQSFLEQRVDGIILWSMLPQNEKAAPEKAKVPMLLISRNERNNFDGSQIIMSYENAFVRLLRTLSGKGLKNVGLVMERDLLDSCRFQSIFCEYFPESSLIRSVDGSEERAFEAAFELHAECSRPDAFIAGNFETGKGISHALHLLSPDEQPPVFALKEGSWLDDTGVFAGVIDLSVEDLVTESMHLLMDAVESPQIHENVVSNLMASYFPSTPISENFPQTSHDLHFAMYNCSTARSLRMLSVLYENATGCKICFDMYSYQELEQLFQGSGLSRYDGYMLDLPWFDHLLEGSFLKNLDHLQRDNPGYFEGFPKTALQEYSIRNGSLYTIPFMPGAQMLFYQRDLFENKNLQIKFQRIYGQKLAPPTTWSEFNAVAEFFTRSLTPDSPVEFGLSMSNGVNVYTAIDFLSRFWACGGKVFDEFGRICINSASGVSALNNLRQSHQYCSGKSLQSWDECASEFSSGKCAMVVLYNSDAGDINNYARSRVAGNIGVSMIPGGTPVMGGWSLAVNPQGPHQLDTEQFFLWACSGVNCVPMSLLGGSTLQQEYYRRADLDQMVPWKNLVPQSILCSKKRTVPRTAQQKWGNEIYVSIIPREIMRFIQGEVTARQALQNMEDGIRQLLEG